MCENEFETQKDVKISLHIIYVINIEPINIFCCFSFNIIHGYAYLKVY